MFPCENKGRFWTNRCKYFLFNLNNFSYFVYKRTGECLTVGSRLANDG